MQHTTWESVKKALVTAAEEVCGTTQGEGAWTEKPGGGVRRYREVSKRRGTHLKHGRKMVLMRTRRNIIKLRKKQRN